MSAISKTVTQLLAVAVLAALAAIASITYSQNDGCLTNVTGGGTFTCGKGKFALALSSTKTTTMVHGFQVRNI